MRSDTSQSKALRDRLTGEKPKKEKKVKKKKGILSASLGRSCTAQLAGCQPRRQEGQEEEGQEEKEGEEEEAPWTGTSLG